MAALELYNTTFFNDPNLQGYWRLENVNDSGPNGYNLTNFNTATFAAGEFNNAVNLSQASTQYLKGSATKANVSTSQTWVAWVKLTTTGAGNMVCGFRNSDGTQYKGILLEDGVGGTPQFYLNGLTSEALLSSVLTTSIRGVFAFLAMRYDSVAGTFACWVNGTKDSQNVTGTPVITTSNNFSIGELGDYHAGTSFNGRIDDVAIFDRALTDNEISGIYNGTFGKTGGAFLLNFI